MIDRVLIDTGPMVALFSEDDQHHERCSEALTALTPPLLTCWPVVTEAAWLLRKQPTDLHNLFKGFAGGLFALLTLNADDLPAVADLMKRYESSALQLADATLAHLAEREKIRTVFTTDRRDFSILRLKRNRTLRLIPDIQ
ncbi:MAG TPA: PIN domain-containing protein [Isosphaeraceae bacterium]|nr:PIN domain-containing protein [Isosphaeraceae bacterium]